jgi:hypothetical protein
MGGSTLLGRRHRRAGEPSPLSRIPAGTPAYANAPQSPMRGVEATG